jgi:hypothetical protein
MLSKQKQIHEDTEIGNYVLLQDNIARAHPEDNRRRSKLGVANPEGKLVFLLLFWIGALRYQ